MRYYFRIPIGDYSGDGHRISDDYVCSASKPPEEVRKAYLKTAEMLPKSINPNAFCDEYEDPTMPVDTYKELEKLGAPLPIEKWYRRIKNGSITNIDSEYMIKLLVWFINQGDPDLDLRNDTPDYLILDQFGYGCCF